MAHPYLRKTLLALAIATPQSLLANTVNLTGSQVTLNPIDYINSIDYSTPLLLTGQVTDSGFAIDLQHHIYSYFPAVTNQANLRSLGENSYALGLNSQSKTYGEITSNLVNEGQINSDGTGSSGILFGAFSGTRGLVNSAIIRSNGDESAGIRLGTGAFIFGELNNSGSISATGARAAGIEFSESGAEYVTQLNNSGQILATGLEAKGISLKAPQSSTRLDNSGSIVANGEYSRAVNLEDGSMPSLYNQNSSLISATGNYSRGISIEQGSPDFTGSLDLNNDGVIQVNGRESVSIFIDHPNNLSLLENNGEISAGGADSRAIVLVNRHSTAPLSISHELSLTNTGTIRSEGIAIELAESSTYIPSSGDYWVSVRLYNSGLIEGGQAAIKGSGNVLLDVFGGEIRGDLLGLKVMFTSGDVLFNGRLIQSPTLWVSSLELGQPHTRLEGNLSQSNSTLDLNLHRQTDPRRAILEVSGDALFGYFGPNQIRLKPASADFRGLPLREYILISAARIEDQGSSYGTSLQVTSLSDLLQIQSYEVTDTQVTAVVKSLPTEQVGDYLREQGAQPHLLPAFSAFYGNTLGSLSNDDPLFEATIQSNDEALVRLAQQLAPEVNGAAGQTAASNHNLLGNVLQGRSASLRQGLSSGDGLSRSGAWVQLLSSDADQGSRNGVPGYDADSQGIAVGADAKPNAQTTLGLAYSYLTSDVRSQTGNKTAIDGHALTLYGGFEQGAWFADASLTYGRSDNESRRYIAGTRAEGDYDSQLWGLNLLGGYGFDLGQGLLLEPRMAARYSNAQIDGFREQGSSAALAVGDQRYEVGEIGAGVRLAGHFAAGQGRLEPEAKLMAYHDLIADRVSSTSAFVVGGTPFVTGGAKPARDSYAASLGLTYRLGAVSLGVSYDYLSKADYSADTVQARVRYDF